MLLKYLPWPHIDLSVNIQVFSLTLSTLANEIQLPLCNFLLTLIATCPHKLLAVSQACLTHLALWSRPSCLLKLDVFPTAASMTNPSSSSVKSEAFLGEIAASYFMPESSILLLSLTFPVRMIRNYSSYYWTVSV